MKRNQFSTPFPRTLVPSATSLRVVAGGRGNLLTVRDVADRLRLSTATVYTLVERGQLPHVRVSNSVRVVPADLDAFIARGKR